MFKGQFFLALSSQMGLDVDVWVITLGRVRLRRLANILNWPCCSRLCTRNRRHASTPGAGQGLLRYGKDS